MVFRFYLGSVGSVVNYYILYNDISLVKLLKLFDWTLGEEALIKKNKVYPISNNAKK